MGHVVRLLALIAALLVGTMPLAAMDGAKQGNAGAKKSTAKDATAAGTKKEQDKAAATAQRLLDSGVKSYQDGKNKQAVRAFDAVLRNGGLSSQQIARALYFRGLAYRKQDKPGLAISDLTSAIWLKDGLSPSEKQDALSNRVAAYGEAGISNVPRSDQPEVAASGSNAPASLGNGSGAAGWQTATSGSAATQAPPAAMAPSPTVATAQPPASSSSSGSSGGIGGFFNSIFGGGSSSSNSAPNASASNDQVTTSSINNGAQTAAPAEASSWSSTTMLAAESGPHSSTASPPPSAKRTAAVNDLPPPVTPAKPPTSGKYRLQVGAVRTRPEADLLVARVLTEYGGELGGRDPEIDEAVIGSMGTFFRVRVGPYADTKEPQKLCGALRTSGFDCLVITN